MSSDPYRDVAKLLITRIMAKVPANASREHLEIVLRNSMPEYRDQCLSHKAWLVEQEIAVREWGADLPGLCEKTATSCSGGPLVQAPISTAKPIPLPCEALEQADFPI